MKVLVVSVLCVLVGAATGGAVLPLTSLYKTIIPAQTKSFGYSTTQYINTLPASYPAGLQPHFTYQVPQFSSFAPQQTYYTIPGGSAYFSSIPFNSFYPGAASIAPVSSIPTFVGAPNFPALQPAAPSFPSQPGSTAPLFPNQQPAPSAPTQQPAGDSDTAVVDSADFPNQDKQQTSAPANSRPTTAPGTPSTFPNFPQTLQDFPAIPQIPQQIGQVPSFPQNPQFPQGSEQAPPSPQIPQGSGEAPSLPEVPQGSGQTPSFPQLPQFPQVSDQVPSFPQIPQFPQGSGQGPSFPQIPQFPQEPGQGPSFPQIPQFPQGSEQGPSFPQIPQFPQFPPFPQSPNPTPSPPSSFPGATNQDQGLNDEDTISVESA
ncbi:uncharacterized protein [Choristoneura fumiferana]|uniref:uncharacterized protein n=1 Tax=Choristoneura fumiferana TaxID=7141 RepID=UPI003D158F97